MRGASSATASWLAEATRSVTAFLLQHGYHTLQNGKVVVVLAPQFANPTAWKRKSRLIKVLSVHQASDDRRIHV
jgi:hypothetical protein